MVTPRTACAVLAAFAVLASADRPARAADGGDDTFHGQIRAMRVIGDVEAIDDQDRTATPLHNGDLLYEGYTVITHAQASVVLVFSNGSTLRLMPDTKLDVARFVQSPFDQDSLAVGRLAAEPSTSTTNLRFEYGELVGQVLPLHAGSTHEIDTPVGAAGIRGTTFRHFYRVDAAGNAHYALDTHDGVVVFTAPNGRRTPVRAGREYGGFLRAGQPAGRMRFRLMMQPPHARFVFEHHLPFLRAAAAHAVFRRADSLFPKHTRPKIRRDAAARRDTDDDIATMDREERAAAAHPPPPRPPPPPRRK